jgi:hypothetical protein
MAKDDAESDLARRLTDKIRHGRSPMQKWLWLNYDQIIQAMPGPRRNWRVLSEAAIEAKQLDADGKLPNANSIRAAFNRVKRIKDASGTDAVAQPPGPSAMAARRGVVRPSLQAVDADSPNRAAPRRTFVISTPKKEL